MKILLTETEIDAIRLEWYGDEVDTKTRMYSELVAMSAEAQLKKVVEWLKQYAGYTDRFSVNDFILTPPEEDWQALLKEVEDD